MFTTRARLAWTLLYALLLEQSAWAQHGETPSYTVRPIPDRVDAPVIDGRLDDQAWALAPVLGPFRQVEPRPGSTPSESTEVRILRDDSSIFVFVKCFDRDPSAIRATQRRRDVELGPDDSVRFFFDTFHDQRNAFWFQIGAGGSRGDALITKNGASFNLNWDGIWNGKARVTSDGWQAEIEIPAVTLNFDQDSAAWGFNFQRIIKRRNEIARWASPHPRIRFTSVANAGTLHGVSGLKQGIGLDVVPFVVGDYNRVRPLDQEDVDADVGLDAFYRITPNFKVSASFNTDFAETEVDARRVNLTRFPLFFPEKRDFFLEDSGNFFFGPPAGATPDVLAFFTRRIGLDARRREVPIRGAVRFAGSTDDFSVGLMGVQTDDPTGSGSKNLLVGRLTKFLGEQSDVGLILTHGNPSAEPRSTTYGADLNYRTHRFRGRNNLEFHGYYLRTDTEGTDDREQAYHLGVEYPNDELELAASWTVIDQNFNPRLGFVRRRNVKKYEGLVRYAPRLHTSVRQLEFMVEPVAFTDSDDDLKTLDIRFRPVGALMESGDRSFVRIDRRREVLDEPFRIRRGVVIPVGRHDWWRYGLVVQSAGKRPLDVGGAFFFGSFYTGDRTDWEFGATYRPGGLVEFLATFLYNDVRLPQGDFVSRIVRIDLNLLFSADVTWSNLIQYDNESETVGINSRLWVIVRPGHDIFLVGNQSWNYDSGDLTPVSSQVIAKMGYTLRF